MERLFAQIANVLKSDPGNRGLAGSLPDTSLSKLAEELMAARRVIIVTGFPIKSCSIGETDGPCGAANIAYALTHLEKEVTIVTDVYSYDMVTAACALRAPSAQMACVPMKGAEAFCRCLLDEIRPTHVIAIERPGKSFTGHFYNMRGEIIDDMVADTELLLTGTNAVTIGIGDGGNELGMGARRAQIEACVPHGKTICADFAADYTLVSGVSNWWGWGIAAMLSLKSGLDLLPTGVEEACTLWAVVNAGGVDGISLKNVPTVDGLSLADNLKILERLTGITAMCQSTRYIL